MKNYSRADFKKPVWSKSLFSWPAQFSETRFNLQTNQSHCGYLWQKWGWLQREKLCFSTTPLWAPDSNAIYLLCLRFLLSTCKMDGILNSFYVWLAPLKLVLSNLLPSVLVFSSRVHAEAGQPDTNLREITRAHVWTVCMPPAVRPLEGSPGQPLCRPGKWVRLPSPALAPPEDGLSLTSRNGSDWLLSKLGNWTYSLLQPGNFVFFGFHRNVSNEMSWLLVTGVEAHPHPCLRN